MSHCERQTRLGSRRTGQTRALGKDPAADVYYDEGRKKLTLSNLTAELVGVIEKELLARVG
jgi:hypothetical protein